MSNSSIKSICVYCGSSPGADPAYAEAARAFGSVLVKEGITLVYGGGNVGLMGIIAETVMRQGGKVIGIIPQHLLDMEVGKRDVTELYVVETMHERKAKMADMSDAFVAMPGGVGTLEEIIEISVWNQLALHAKPCALLNINGYYDPLIEFLDHMVTQRFLKQHQRDILKSVDAVDAVMPALLKPLPLSDGKWIDR
jgi:uncharacterized protein (TIGR00730 family)